MEMNLKDLKKASKKCAKSYAKAYKKRREVENLCEKMGIDVDELSDAIDVNLVHENTPKKFTKLISALLDKKNENT